MSKETEIVELVVETFSKLGEALSGLGDSLQDAARELQDALEKLKERNQSDDPGDIAK